MKYKLIIEYIDENQKIDEIYFKNKEIANYYKQYYLQNNSVKRVKIIRINNMNKWYKINLKII